MKNYKIAVIQGDGIGPEVIREGVKVLECICALDKEMQISFTYFPWGCHYYREHGCMMEENGIEILKEFDAIYLGAVGSPEVPDHISLWGLLLKIRKSFDQYVNLRPVKLLNGVPCPLKNGNQDKIDMVVVRENSEGEYAGAGEWLYAGQENEVVLQTSVFSRKGVERVMRYGFELARSRKKTITSISKGNALNYSMVFWDKMFEEIGKEYPDVERKTLLVDAASMLFVLHPEQFDVVVTSNLFGDILTDLGAAICGGMGMAAGANVNPERRFPSMFEPVHGSAPDIAGKNIANPIAAIWSVSQMLEFLGEKAWAEIVLEAIEKNFTEKGPLTPDAGGTAATAEVGDGIVKRITIRTKNSYPLLQ